MSARFQRQHKASSWRRVAPHTWGAPGDPTVYGLLDVDVQNALDYIDTLRARTQVHVTLSHLVGKAVSLAIAERPEVNAILRRGRRVYLRDGVDVFFQVAFDGGENLSGTKIARADEKSVVELATEMQQRTRRIREHSDRDLGRSHRLLEQLPHSLRRPLLRAVSFATYELGLDLRRFGLPYDQFGSIMITNVGTFGIPSALVPLVPFSYCPVLMSIGAVQRKPIAIGDTVRIRPVVTFGATFDHRLLDGYQAGRMAARFQQVLEDPHPHLGAPAEQPSIEAQ